LDRIHLVKPDGDGTLGLIPVKFHQIFIQKMATARDGRKLLMVENLYY
jgi:hypothetical protein